MCLTPEGFYVRIITAMVATANPLCSEPQLNLDNYIVVERYLYILN